MFLCHISQFNFVDSRSGVPNDIIFRATKQSKTHGTRVVGQNQPARFDLGYLPAFDLFAKARANDLIGAGGADHGTGPVFVGHDAQQDDVRRRNWRRRLDTLDNGWRRGRRRTAGRREQRALAGIRQEIERLGGERIFGSCACCGRARRTRSDRQQPKEQRVHAPALKLHHAAFLRHSARSPSVTRSGSSSAPTPAAGSVARMVMDSTKT
jgi:hypothetical protein